MPIPTRVASRIRPTLPPSIGAVPLPPRLPTLSALGPLRHVSTTSFKLPTTSPTTPRPSSKILLPTLLKHRFHTTSPRNTPAQTGQILKMAERVHRVTMFKLPNKQHQETLIEAYKVLSSEQKRDGKPYILSLVVGPALDDPRSKGFTLVAKTEFASLDDMRWYDSDCPAHDKLKGLVREFGIGPDEILSIYFEPGHVAVI